jgi:hypothetical protein
MRKATVANEMAAERVGMFALQSGKYGRQFRALTFAINNKSGAAASTPMSINVPRPACQQEFSAG